MISPDIAARKDIDSVMLSNSCPSNMAIGDILTSVEVLAKLATEEEDLGDTDHRTSRVDTVYVGPRRGRGG